MIGPDSDSGSGCAELGGRQQEENRGGGNQYFWTRRVLNNNKGVAKMSRKQEKKFYTEHIRADTEDPNKLVNTKVPALAGALVKTVKPKGRNIASNKF